MGDCYIGEIRLLPYMRGAPEGWQACDGSILQISQYETLFQLLSTTYGGDGNQTFGVPDLRSRVPVHQGAGTGLSPRTLGSTGGEESVTLNSQQMGAHFHYPLASPTAASSNSPAGNVLAAVPSSFSAGFYTANPSQGTSTQFPATMLQPAGQSQPHDNTAPTITMQYCIATNGIWPAQS